MFLGRFDHAVDAKGRVAIPAQLRRDLGGDAVISIGPEGRLMLWPTAQAWQGHSDSLRLTAGTPAERRKLLSVSNSMTFPVDLDGQGRLLLSTMHREFAGIRERATFVGQMDHIEVLATEGWEEYTADVTRESFTELYDRVNPVGAAAPAPVPS